MSFDQARADLDRRLDLVLSVVLAIALTAAGVWIAWQLNRPRQWAPGRLPPPHHNGLPHADAGEDVVEAASEDSFPASDPPAYTSGDRLGRPARDEVPDPSYPASRGPTVIPR